MTDAYPGPLRDEPLAIELHNTLYAGGGEAHDGLESVRSARAWLDGLAGRLPAAGRGRDPSADELIALRGAVRATLHAALDGSAPPRASMDALNRASARAPRAARLSWRNGEPRSEVDFGSATRSDIVLSFLAADAIELVSGQRRRELRACGAPGCVLMFLKSHGRREWCSDACGNRARQARHYARTRASRGGR